MKIKDAFLQGLEYLFSVKRWLFLILILQFILVLFPGIALKDSIASSLGKSRAAETMLTSFDARWYAYFSENARGPESSFQPAVNGIGAVLEPLNQFIAGNITGNYPIFIGLGILYALVWVFFTPGLLSRFQEFLPRENFFSLSSRYFFKILLISSISLLAIYLVFTYPFSWLSNLIKSLTRETIDERIVFLYTILKYMIIWILILSVRMISDYAKIHLVIHEIQNPFSAIYKALNFILRNPGKTYGLYFLNLLVWILCFLIYWLIAPGALHSSGWYIFMGFLIGQLYILTRISIRGLFLASQAALCQPEYD